MSDLGFETEDRIAAIRNRAAAAMPEPWVVDDHVYVECASDEQLPELAVPPDLVTGEQRNGIALGAPIAQCVALRAPANALFIAHARSDVEFLLRLVDELAKHREQG